MIKKILIALVMGMFLAGSALADTVNVQLTWEHDIPADLAGFRLYSDTSTVTNCSEAVGPKVGDDIPYVEGEPLETSYQVVGPQGEIHYFRVTAFDESNNESGCSEEVSFTIPDVAPGVPFNVTIEVIVTP
jgi:hypothetical protein